MAAACVQFGSVICKNDLAALNAGQPCGGANPVTAKYSVPQSSWTQDGNGQTICSWGKNIQANINSCTVRRKAVRPLGNPVAWGHCASRYSAGPTMARTIGAA